MGTRRGRTKTGTNGGSYAPAGTGNDAAASVRYAELYDDTEEDDEGPPDDACGLCMMRRAAPGMTACSTCA